MYVKIYRAEKIDILDQIFRNISKAITAILIKNQSINQNHND